MRKSTQSYEGLPCLFALKCSTKGKRPIARLGHRGEEDCDIVAMIQEAKDGTHILKWVPLGDIVNAWNFADADSNKPSSSATSPLPYSFPSQHGETCYLFLITLHRLIIATDKRFGFITKKASCHLAKWKMPFLFIQKCKLSVSVFFFLYTVIFK